MRNSINAALAMSMLANVGAVHVVDVTDYERLMVETDPDARLPRFHPAEVKREPTAHDAERIRRAEQKRARKAQALSKVSTS